MYSLARSFCEHTGVVGKARVLGAYTQERAERSGGQLSLICNSGKGNPLADLHSSLDCGLLYFSRPYSSVKDITRLAHCYCMA